MTMVSQADSPDPQTRVERPSNRELVVIRCFRAPVHLVYRAWADPALFRQWWVPRSYGMTLVSCEMDVRDGGTEVTISNLFPSAEALEQELASGACDGTAESLHQLDEFLRT